LILQRSFNKDIVDYILLHEDIFHTISEDHILPKPHSFDLDKDAYVTVTVNNQTIGLYIFNAINSVTLGIHAHILKEFRKEYAIESGQKALQWIVNNTQHEKVIAEVPECYVNVVGFCKVNGLIVEGVNRLSYRKDGQLIDVINLGITKEEIQKLEIKQWVG